MFAFLHCRALAAHGRGVGARGGWQRPGSPVPRATASEASAFVLPGWAGKGFSVGPPKERRNQYAQWVLTAAYGSWMGLDIKIKTSAGPFLACEESLSQSTKKWKRGPVLKICYFLGKSSHKCHQQAREKKGNCTKWWVGLGGMCVTESRSLSHKEQCLTVWEELTIKHMIKWAPESRLGHKTIHLVAVLAKP